MLLADVGDGPARTVRALDPATGEVVWERDVDLGSTMNQMVLDGVLYGSGTSSAWAVDAVTGETRWSTHAGASDAWQVQTDGRVLLRTEQAPGRGELVGYSLRDGDVAWRTELPEGVGSLWQTHGLLLGQRGASVVTLR
ncbi:PQQ-binding-like beta-propeller repeat protein [Cellulomonas sp. ES6]|uniref:outer membrane protein assembly factor BamB family protein n=1 Tax=Cellulomonas sp. ES6 TaxID=3039384 RepID=UPI0024B83689|nr:PQQ-binding-like beta-propeller repeat protein [Cellulomonas sp. ES6]WHP16919.1 PQQ-binding-like beta-propeller repeat protein [Cellulomonas sp. ES6]